MKHNVFINNQGHLCAYGREVSWADNIRSYKLLVPNPAGNILMYGLGLGKDTLWTLEHEAVTKLVVVEKYQEVIDLFVKRFPTQSSDARLTLKQGTYPEADTEEARKGFDLVVYSLPDSYDLL